MACREMEEEKCQIQSGEMDGDLPGRQGNYQERKDKTPQLYL